MTEPPGSYHICDVCGWEDDHVQLAHPRLRGGANSESLAEAQVDALRRFPLHVQSIDRMQRDPEWRALREDESPCLAGADSPRSGVEYFEAASTETVTYYWKKDSA